MSTQYQDVNFHTCGLLHSGTFNVGIGATITTMETYSTQYITVYPVFVILSSYSKKCESHYLKVGGFPDAVGKPIST